MKLEVGYIPIRDIRFGPESKVDNNVLYVNKRELSALILADEGIASVALDLARPGESVRITPVKDVIEPRVKVSGTGGIFPGWCAKVRTVGEGRTHV
ncbi:MAG: glycine/sarcosine/betaine reductase component B subunit, partial [Anaerovoracaceae bacterium]